MEADRINRLKAVLTSMHAPRGAIKVVALLERCLIVDTMAHALGEWRGACALIHSRRAFEAEAVRSAQLEATVARLSSRPLKSESEAQAERRRRLEAEEAARQMERKCAKLQRVAAAAPALRAKEGLVTRLVTDEAEGMLRVAANEASVLARTCKLSAIASWLRLMRFGLLATTLSAWRSAARAMRHAEDTAAVRKAAERQGYSRALSAALAAERVSATAGDEVVSRQREAAQQRALIDSLRAELASALAGADDDRRSAQAAAQKAAVELQVAHDEVAAMVAQCKAADANESRASAARDAARQAAEAASAVATAATETLNTAHSVRSFFAAQRVGGALRALGRSLCSNALYTWKLWLLGLQWQAQMAPLKRELRGAPAPLAHRP